MPLSEDLGWRRASDGRCWPGLCHSPQHAEMAPAAGVNVPAAPAVDRSKCSDKGKQIVTADTNLDKKPDVWKFYQRPVGGQSAVSCRASRST